MIAAWMVSLSGWVLLPLAVLAGAGCVLVGLIVWDEVQHQKQKREIQRRSEQRRMERGTR